MITFVPTPIGHRGDITSRALEVLSEADIICCEDTRHSSPLLKHYEIYKPLVSLHDHNEAHKAEEIVQRAIKGDAIAVISDAGMPAISDPGYRLLRACIQHGADYTVLPGPSAVLTALVGSNFPVHSFYFGGFLSQKKGKRRTVLEHACAQDFTSVFFESPHRILSTLKIIAEFAPEQPICVARELTKKFETYHRGTAHHLAEYFEKKAAKGEIVLLVAPSSYQLIAPHPDIADA